MSPDAMVPQRGRYFEEFEKGFTWVTPARTITEHDIGAFAGLSGDFNPLHTDREFAKTTQFGERIAHGMLGLSVATGLVHHVGPVDGTAIAFLGVDWKFRKAILIGDTIHAIIKVTDKRESKPMGGGVIGFDVRVVNQDGDVVQKGVWTLLVRMRPLPAEGG
ncbi:MAG: MaoC/PaaZ C-terminal domain-containing protein [Anaerolineae bacterium]|jgi:acyl dehydratase|nr:MaoC family dehydratase N-terminal domain-containing protein [Ardenticatenia bacterium]HQZ70552.1 MaoC/PaaZ C-terminal domain-containing protein [Anaerolineae bacterium]HRA21557.1 MaoC/PaaZ C-terminal domain-containing protein [Anaerolineae bacterium]